MIKYIFCINPGRTGSEYISGLFACVRDVASFHEPRPILHASAMQQYLLGNPEPLKALIPARLSFIRESLQSKKYYFEANHIFIKGFGWLIPSYLPREEIGVIVLKRDQMPVVDSLYKVHAHPFTTTGENWIIVPQFYKDNLVPYPPEYDRMSFNFYKFQYRIFNKLRKFLPVSMPSYITAYSKKLVKWYVDETYALGDKFQENFKDIKVVHINLEDLNSIEGFKNVLEQFGIPAVFETDMADVIGKKVNVRETSATKKWASSQ